MMNSFDIPMLVRGKLIWDDLVEFDARRGELSFRAPDVAKHIDQIPLSNPGEMSDMYELRFDDVVDYMDQLGRRLRLEDNPHMQQAFELSCLTSGLTRDILRRMYRDVIPPMFVADRVREVAETRIGIQQLEGWTKQELPDGRIDYVRPLGARCIHVTAGNAPLCAGMTVLWNCITRGDAVVKSPSNDPLTSLAIGRTMIDMAPDHPLTKHYSVVYWKGGNREFESAIYTPENFEKIVAWGGFSSMKHITRYLQPGLELVAMDPKLSATIIGKEVFESDDVMREVAGLVAVDIAENQQEGCVSARVVSVQSGTDDEGLAKLKTFAEYTYDAMLALPPEISGPHEHFDPELRDELRGIMGSQFYDVIGQDDNLGAIIVSKFPDPVDFADRLSCRVANFVPFDDIEEALRLITVHTQTIGVYPASLKRAYRERLAFLGGQRIVAVGHHHTFSANLPHDAMEPVRRLCRWINDEDCTTPAFTAAKERRSEIVEAA